MTEKLFYIVTPEPLERLARVNCLTLGKNQLPHSVYSCNKVVYFVIYVSNIFFSTQKYFDSNTLPYTSGQLPSMAIARPIRERLACN